ncbi:MAG: EscU/YscU/HrcU family type III secretion system export apparatus switch protein [Planctomycetota bacterium]|nr:EscU/YscU/HrcU family type III secretion system export apparatus switch protein [Planctomycetota bacterium]
MERIHEPSPIRLAQAKEKGDVGRSAELSRSLILSAMLGSVFIFAGTIHELASEKIRESIADVKVKLTDLSVTSQTEIGFDWFFPFLYFLTSILCVGVLVWHFQSPLTPRVQRANPDFSRISPGSSMARILSAESISQGLFGLVGFLVLASVAILILFNQTKALVSVSTYGSERGIQIIGSFLRNVFVASGVVLVVLGFVDYLWQRWRIANKLKMTDQERRDEAKETEMNPLVRKQILR